MADMPREISAWIEDEHGPLGKPWGYWNSLPYDPEAVQVDRYVLATEADRIKRERDEAYRALVDIRDAGRDGKGQTAASLRAQAALDAISAMTTPSRDRVHVSSAVEEDG